MNRITNQQSWTIKKLGFLNHINQTTVHGDIEIKMWIFLILLKVSTIKVVVYKRTNCDWVPNTYLTSGFCTTPSTVRRRGWALLSYRRSESRFKDPLGIAAVKQRTSANSSTVLRFHERIVNRFNREPLHETGKWNWI